MRKKTIKIGSLCWPPRKRLRRRVVGMMKNKKGEVLYAMVKDDWFSANATREFYHESEIRRTRRSSLKKTKTQ